MSTRRRLGLVLYPVALVACVSGGERPQAEVDTREDDVDEVTPGDTDEDGSVGSDASPGEDGDGLDEVIVGGCVLDEDCLAADVAVSPCQGWVCDDGTCRLAGLGPETRCDNGTGPAVGSCVEGGFVREDHCEAGECVDDPPAPGDVRGPAFDGTWFYVRTTFGRFGVPGTSRAIINMDPSDNSFGLGANDGDGGAAVIPLDHGYLCGADDGTLEARLGAWSLSGHQVDGELAALTDSLSDGFDLLLRADQGSTTQVDGEYRYIATSIIFGDTKPTTWVGTARFQDGCLENGMLSADPALANTFTFEGAPTDCLTASTVFGEAGLFTLDTHVVRSDGSDPTHYPIHYRGAIGPAGDVLMLVKEVDSGNGMRIEYGVTFFVRRDGDSVTAEALAGDWHFYQQARLGGDPPRRDAGWMRWELNGAISGGELVTLDGARSVTGGWFALDEVERRFSQVLVIDHLETTSVGIFEPSNRFAIGWFVAPAQVGTTPMLFGPTPSAGSLMVLLRP